jgi:hypothetical protein
LIITTNDLKSAFEPLKQAHDVDGIRTQIRTLVNDIPVSYDENNTIDNIRDYIRDEYTNSHIKYVLIGGDSNIVPDRTFYCEAGTTAVLHMPSDLYYACLDGPFNNDHDWYWGEPNDGTNGGDVDLLAEVAVGRACVGNTTEVNNFVGKTIQYLQTNDSYLTKTLLVGEILMDQQPYFTDGANYTEEYIDTCENNAYTTTGIPSSDYSIDRLYDRNGVWTTTDILNKINAGTHIINHVGHSSVDMNMRITNSDVVSSLYNENPCFIYSQGCEAGYFTWLDDDCFAEYMTVKTGYGAFAGVWNTVLGWFRYLSTDGPSQCFQREYWNAVFGKDIKELGKANQVSKEDNVHRINEMCMRWCYYNLELFGDPSVSFQNIRKIDVGSISASKGVVTAVVTNIGPAAVQNISWNLSVSGGLFGHINSSSTGTIHSLPVGDTRDIQIDDRIFGLGQITIVVSASASSSNHVSKIIHGFIFGHFIITL